MEKLRKIPNGDLALLLTMMLSTSSLNKAEPRFLSMFNYIHKLINTPVVFPSVFLFLILQICCWKIWPPGSLEEKVQNIVKTWEMEMFHKSNFEDYKTVNPKNYTFSLNGR